MEYRTLGATGLIVSAIGLGTWPMSGAWWGDADDAASVRTIHRALERGVTLIDTAESYGAGHAEEVVGRALAGRRAEAVIADKVAPNHLQPDQLRQAFAASCARLGTDYLDVYFIHWPNIDLPIGPAMEELERMRRDGKIRAIGVSNFTVAEMETARQHGRIDMLQPPYNLFWRSVERAEAPYCLQHGIGVMTYSSLAQGLLTGTLSRDTVFSPDDQRTSTVLFQPEVYRQCLDAVDQLRPIAQRNGKTVAQLAIRWLTGQPAVTTALLGARTVEEIEENVQGVDWTLSPEDVARIEAAVRPVAERVAAYPDMFGNWERWDLQRRRYAQSGRLPTADTGGANASS